MSCVRFTNIMSTSHTISLITSFCFYPLPTNLWQNMAYAIHLVLANSTLQRLDIIYAITISRTITLRYYLNAFLYMVKWQTISNINDKLISGCMWDVFLWQLLTLYSVRHIRTNYSIPLKERMTVVKKARFLLITN